MRAALLLSCLWPGLVGLWLRGQWKGLAAALGFAALLNFALVASFVWPELLGVTLRQLVWPVVGAAWVMAVWRNWKNLPGPTAPETGSSSREDLFLGAQTEYLNGHWLEAESLMERLLGSWPTDVDAHLMLATLYRHTGRLAEAGRQLRWLERQPGSEKWWFEIAEERRRLSRLAEKAKVDEDKLSSIDDGSQAVDPQQPQVDTAEAA